MRGAALALMLLGAVPPLGAQEPPILDMHLHALPADAQGPPPLAICAPFPSFPAWDQREPWGSQFLRMSKDPTCEDAVWSPETDEELRDETIEVVERLNVYGVLSGSAERVREWRAAAPGRFLPGLVFQIDESTPSTDSLRALFEAGDLAVLGEVTNQYMGVGPGDGRMAPYWAVAEELDLPVGLHMGPGPPGGIYLGQTPYRASLGNPLLLEDVLVRHPRLRVYVMHAGYPFLDETLALLYAHPQVYVGLGVVVFTRPREDFYRFLEALIDAGFGDRVMFGSDQMVWPGAIERAVATIREAPFLTEEQKRAILYENAARFLRLSEAERARHHGRRP